jgi:hypothetical protein
LANSSSRRLRTHGRGQVHTFSPVTCLCDQRDCSGTTATEDERINHNIFWVDRAPIAFGIGLDPSNIVTNRSDFPSLLGSRRENINT